jgi:hypothetical protein
MEEAPSCNNPRLMKSVVDFKDSLDDLPFIPIKAAEAI